MNRKIIIKTALASLDMTQSELATEAQIARSILNQIISGRVNPSASEKEAIARALRKPVKKLFPEATA